MLIGVGRGLRKEREDKGECGSSEVNALLRCKRVRRGSLILLLEHNYQRTNTLNDNHRLTKEKKEWGTIFIDEGSHW